MHAARAMNSTEGLCTTLTVACLDTLSPVEGLGVHSFAELGDSEHA